jgi:hypothetical protein
LPLGLLRLLLCQVSAGSDWVDMPLWNWFIPVSFQSGRVDGRGTYRWPDDQLLTRHSVTHCGLHVHRLLRLHRIARMIAPR